MNYHTHQRPEMTQFLPDSYHRVLEIGCGNGVFKQNLSQTPEEYWGIELDPGAAAVAEKSLTKVLVGDVFHSLSSVPDNYFDLIICNDVIEHLPSETEFFKAIKPKMTSHGYLIGSIPNFRHVSNLHEILFQKDWEYKDAGLLDKTHLRFFTEKSLQRAFAAASLKIEKMAGINDVKITTGRWNKKVQKLMVKVLGQDTKYLQFGFRVQKKGE